MAGAEWAMGRAKTTEHTPACAAIWMAVGGCTCAEQEAAGRAETTTAAESPVPPTGHRWPCVGFYITSTEHVRCTCPEVTGPDLAEATGYRDTVCGHLVHECRCGSRAESTTATTEDALADLAHLILDTLHFEPSTRDAEMDGVMYVLRRHLLATARTRPTREQVARALDHAGAYCGECGNEPGEVFDRCSECRPILVRYADAVLTLLEGGA